MFVYENTSHTSLAEKVQPDIQLYDMLKTKLHGCHDGLQAAMCYIRESYMLLNRDFRHVFLQAAVQKLNDMELLAAMLHRLHGMDDSYFDVMLETDPLYHVMEGTKDKPSSAAIHNDAVAALLVHDKQERAWLQVYEEASRLSADDGSKQCLQQLSAHTQATIDALQEVREYLREHAKTMDFGEAGTSWKAWDVATSNYFDKPNPEFYHPSK